MNLPSSISQFFLIFLISPLCGLASGQSFPTIPEILRMNLGDYMPRAAERALHERDGVRDFERDLSAEAKEIEDELSDLRRQGRTRAGSEVFMAHATFREDRDDYIAWRAQRDRLTDWRRLVVLNHCIRLLERHLQGLNRPGVSTPLREDLREQGVIQNLGTGAEVGLTSFASEAQSPGLPQAVRNRIEEARELRSQFSCCLRVLVCFFPCIR